MMLPGSISCSRWNLSLPSASWSQEWLPWTRGLSSQVMTRQVRHMPSCLSVLSCSTASTPTVSVRMSTVLNMLCNIVKITELEVYGQNTMQGLISNYTTQQTQNICITFIQCWTNVEDKCFVFAAKALLQKEQCIHCEQQSVTEYYTQSFEQYYSK